MSRPAVERVHEVFQEVARQPPARRSARLDELCAGDAALRDEVQALLDAAHDADREGFFIDPTGNVAAPVPSATSGFDAADSVPPPPEFPTPEREGSTIGPYKLLQQIGEGGFGTVYMAEQHEPIRRKVALKIIRPGMDTGEVLARFEAERQALALMDHPAIAHVLDAGATPDGRPYFVMELVHGHPITEYCDHEELPIRERLELFCDVCDAVQHAHHKGVIHRDIKPSNVFVTSLDGRPFPKVIDFGIAKATAEQLTDRTLYTRYGQFLGTPRYMSPEQAEMSAVDVDTRSDVYSLGVLLYELLTDTTPIDAEALRTAGPARIRELIQDSETPRPSTRASTHADLATIARHRRTDPRRLGLLLRGDLDWIVLKALEKDRARRYESPSALAADVRRYLNDEPIAAGPPTTAYKLSKFVRKHRAAVTAAGAMLLLLLLGTAGTTTGWIRAAATSRALAEQNEALEEAREEADRERATAEAVAEYIGGEIIGAASPWAMHGAGLSVSDALDHAAAELEGAIDDPLIEASIRHFLGSSYLDLGRAREAEAQLRRAIELRRAELGPEAPPTIEVLTRHAGALVALPGRTEDAARQFAEARDLAAAALGPTHSQTLTAALGRAGALADLGRLEEAERVHRELLDTATRAHGPSHPIARDAANDLAALLAPTGRLEEAERLIRATLDATRAAQGDDHPDTLHTQHNLASLLADTGRHDEAARLHRETLGACRRVFGPSHPTTLRSLNGLGATYLAMEKLDEAEPILREAAGFWRRDPAARVGIVTSLNLTQCVLARAEAAGDPEQLAEAERLATSALARADGNLADADPVTPVLRILRGKARTGLKRFEEAERDLLTAESTLGDLRAPPAYRGEAVAALAALYRAWDRPDDAARWEAELREMEGGPP